MKEKVGQFLIRRLYESGISDIFGVSGDYILGLLQMMKHSKLTFRSTCNELNAAYAADAYARLNGIGALITTNVVGELSAINGVAGAFAETLPVVCVTGLPGQKEERTDRDAVMPLRNSTSYQIPEKLFREITVAQARINSPKNAVAEIDRCLDACIANSLPVYIAICSDVVHMEIDTPEMPFRKPQPTPSDSASLYEAADEIVRMIKNCKQPVVIPGIDLIRNHLQPQFEDFIEISGLPYVTMMLGKAIIDELHPQFIGLYCGKNSRTYVKSYVDDADFILILGARMTDFNTGGFSARFNPKCTVYASTNTVKISRHIYTEVYLPDLLSQLSRQIKSIDRLALNITPASQGCSHRRNLTYTCVPDAKLKMRRLFDRFSHFVDDHCIVIAETGASLFCVVEMMLPKGATFLGQTFYGSIGYTIGATVGACIAHPHRNVILFVGDGSLQVTAQDMSTLLRYNCKPLIVIVNNEGYTIERVIVDRSYNDIQNWKYSKIMEYFGGEAGYDCFTEGDLDKALTQIAKGPRKLNVVEVHLEKFDCNEILVEAGKEMARNNRLIEEEEGARTPRKIEI